MRKPAAENAVADEAAGMVVADRRMSFALPGLVLAGVALVCAIITLFVLLGVTPIAPTSNVVIASVVINSIFVIGLIFLIGREINRLLKARKRAGRRRVCTCASSCFSPSWRSRPPCLSPSSPA